MELKQKMASEAGHWYSPKGEPAYTVIGKNGKERNTTLRDARELNLLPSVTTIMRVAAAPGLEKWKMQNLLLASLTLPKLEGEDLDTYADRVIKDAQEQSKAAMDLGTSIHGSLEKAYLGQDFPYEHIPHVDATMKAIAEHFGPQKWIAEASFASPLGFGGKTDLHAPNIVIDFKTSAFDDADKKTGYDEHRMQLAAYAEGLRFDKTYRGANVFISTTVPGLVKIIEWKLEELQEGWDMFQCLLKFWQTKNNYFPQLVKLAA